MRRRRGVKLFGPSKDPINIAGKLDEKVGSVAFEEEVAAAKGKDLKNNMLHLAGVFTAVLKRGDMREVISGVRLYVLEEESDLSELELGAGEEKTQWAIKQVIYY